MRTPEYIKSLIKDGRSKVLTVEDAKQHIGKEIEIFYVDRSGNYIVRKIMIFQVVNFIQHIEDIINNKSKETSYSESFREELENKYMLKLIDGSYSGLSSSEDIFYAPGEDNIVYFIS